MSCEPPRTRPRARSLQFTHREKMRRAMIDDPRNGSELSALRPMTGCFRLSILAAGLALCPPSLPAEAVATSACERLVVQAERQTASTSARAFVAPWESIRAAWTECKAGDASAEVTARAGTLARLLPEFAGARQGFEFATELKELLIARGAAPATLIPALEDLAGRLPALDREGEVLEQLDAILDLRAKAFGRESSGFIEGLEFRAQVLAGLAAESFDRGRNEKLAVESAKEAVALARRQFGDRSAESLDSWMNLAQLLETLGRNSEAEGIFDLYRELWSNTQGTRARQN